jgi:hypothetical protein
MCNERLRPSLVKVQRADGERAFNGFKGVSARLLTGQL